MKRVLALLFLSLTLFSAAAEEKGKTMSQRASGSFEVKLEPMAGGAFPRLALKKQFQGDLEGTSVGEMMSVNGTVEGSGAYVAIERVNGTLGGRKGSFALVHNGTMRRGGFVLEGRDHFYKLDYVLPEP